MTADDSLWVARYVSWLITFGVYAALCWAVRPDRQMRVLDFSRDMLNRFCFMSVINIALKIFFKWG